MGKAPRPRASSSAGTGGGTKKPSGGKEPALARAVVFTADLRVRSGNVDASATQAKRLATAAGGFVETEATTTAPPGAALTLRMPAKQYAGVLDQLSRQLGTKLSLRQQAEDVTEKVADVDSRVRSAEATLKSFRALLDQTGDLNEIIRVEDEISSREADLESLQSQQKALQHSTSYGTVKVELVAEQKAAAPAKKKQEHGFVSGLKGGWHALSAFVGGLLVLLGWLLPFLVIAVVIGLLGRPVWRRLRHRLPPLATEWVPAGSPRPRPAASEPTTSEPKASGQEASGQEAAQQEPSEPGVAEPDASGGPKPPTRPTGPTPPQ
ncbi:MULTISPECIES: DUF4349 domain-containing protein [Thermomonosporaceae]|uniref:DUF4349 domain-containing protein n=1 Tax=Thermomonosporaceae TaxID=2012 RepID=UPI00255A95AD|nr:MULTISPECIES: DUF4349 domain-containing protein [Thermomonosporaceae]MDL4774806.1 DUF4349 domain-containing protein [Actinomadura xylanilytica]